MTYPRQANNAHINSTYYTNALSDLQPQILELVDPGDSGFLSEFGSAKKFILNQAKGDHVSSLAYLSERARRVCEP